MSGLPLGHLSLCGHRGGYEALGGWRFGNTINGAQAECLLVPDARANLARIPDELTDEQVVLLASSLGVYSGKLAVPYDDFAAGIGDYRIVTTLCPGGKERMRRLVELVRHGRIDLTPLLTHR